MRCEAVATHWSKPQQIVRFSEFPTVRDAKLYARAWSRRGETVRVDDMSGFTLWVFDGYKWKRPVK